MSDSFNDRDHQYQIAVNGVQLMKGDADSIRVIFSNLDGRNFQGKEKTLPEYEHSEYLLYVSQKFETNLEPGSKISMLSQEGKSLEESLIGKSIQKNDRFRVETIKSNGKVVSQAFTSDAEKAMNMLVQLRKADFGKELGVGSYIALTDNELKLDAAFISEGRGCYSMKFGKDEGRVAFEAAEKLVSKVEPELEVDVANSVVSEGLFAGLVVDVSEGVVTQKVNREGATVRHVLASLSRPVKEGEIVGIKYVNGVGIVDGKDVNDVGCDLTRDFER